MKKDLMDIICCPVCKSDLELEIQEEQNGDIVEGTLYCQECDEEYLIEDSIPNLLPPEMQG